MAHPCRDLCAPDCERPAIYSIGRNLTWLLIEEKSFAMVRENYFYQGQMHRVHRSALQSQWQTGLQTQW
jgi:hypothetical protein